MEAKPITPDREQAWDAFVREARNGHFMFERRFMTYHADRFEDASLAVLQDGVLTGLLPANRAGDTIYSHQGLTFGGLLVQETGTTEALAMLDACTQAFASAGARRLIYKPLPWIYHRRPAQEDLYWLFLRGGRLIRREVTSTVRLSEPGPVSSRRRRGAAKARGADLRYGRSFDFPGYWQLLSEVLAERHEARPVHSPDEIMRLAAAFPANISLHLAHDARGEILAGVVIFLTHQVAHAQYIAASLRGREIGALDGLFLHLMEGFRGQVPYFDFGISNEDQGRVLNQGLIQQKEGFGASAVVHDHYEVELAQP